MPELVSMVKIIYLLAVINEKLLLNVLFRMVTRIAKPQRIICCLTNLLNLYPSLFVNPDYLFFLK